MQDLGLRWWIDDPVDQGALFQDPVLQKAVLQTLRLSCLTMLIAVPLGVAFAIGLDRWRGRLATGANVLMVLTFIVPELILGVTLLLVVRHLLRFIPLGTWAQLVGLVTFQISYPVFIVRARLLTLGRQYEEAAMDLGAPPLGALRRVVLPLLKPAIVASFAVVFADTIDDFVIVRAVSGPASSEPLSLKIYAIARGAPTPAVNAAATLMLVTSLAVIAIGLFVYRRMARKQGDRPGLSDLGL